MKLDDWQIRLERHFAELRKYKTSLVSDYQPIFGLEHGLNNTEYEDLSDSIREQIQYDIPSTNHRLAWIVYATELGYDYKGEEYWQTFEDKTPGWIHHGDRTWLRRCFLWFHEKYGGVKPSGRWAEHFSIISWPITHAILPRDLQRQLAFILYAFRNSFSSELFNSPKMLGEFIAARSWNTTSRFQNLVEETLLVGQIASALLFQGEFGTSALLYQPTLERITKDLENEQRGREWLHSARQSAKERMFKAGPTFGVKKSGPIEGSPQQVREEIKALGIEPRLILRPSNYKKDCWDIILEIPDLSHLLLRFPNLKEVLQNSCCTVAGSSGRPLPRGSFFYGTKPVSLERWPRTDEVLLKFEPTTSQLEFLLRTECMLRPGPIWLFRIATDKCAYETRSLYVRPDEQYILVNTTNIGISSQLIQGIRLTCEGVYGAYISLPSAISEEWEQELVKIGLKQVRTIQVWPSGLAPVIWDGEGYSEWLTSNTPCIAIRSDHVIDSIQISVVEEPNLSLELSSITPGKEVFIELPKLPLGLHTVRVSPDTGDDVDIVMRIIESLPRSSEVHQNRPFFMQLYPLHPTIEDLWEGSIELALLGPEGRQMKCKASFFEKDPKLATVSKQLHPLKLPVSPDEWKIHFEKYFVKLREIQDAYDTARVCELEFKADELGAFKIRCEREFKPLRWAVRHSNKGYVLGLLDDSGNSSQISISRYSFEAPIEQEILKPASIYEVPSLGGLYMARKVNYEASIIIPPEIRYLADFVCNPQIGNTEKSPDYVVNLIKMAKIWGNARLSGNLLSSHRQLMVIKFLTRKVCRILGGDSWEQAELLFDKGKYNVQDLKRAITKRHEELGIAAALTQEYTSLATTSSTERIHRFTSLAVKYLSLPKESTSTKFITVSKLLRKRSSHEDNISNWLCEFALRLTSDPVKVEKWAGEKLKSGISQLIEKPTLVRAARFLVIITDHYLVQNSTPGLVYKGWEWS